MSVSVLLSSVLRRKSFGLARRAVEVRRLLVVLLRVPAVVLLRAAVALRVVRGAVLRVALRLLAAVVLRVALRLLVVVAFVVARRLVVLLLVTILHQ